MILDRVTITGADDSISPKDLLPLSAEFPNVEWGILFSGSRQGTARYPSAEWIEKLWMASSQGLRLSAHLCGKWVRDLVLEGDFSWKKNIGQPFGMFHRIQLNFHAHHHPGEKNFIDILLQHQHTKQFIFQMDGVNDQLFKSAHDAGAWATPLFDRSGGAGVLPKEWPKAYPGVLCGYAGGLSPDNLAEELRKIEAAAGAERIWIDTETRVRSDDDKKFDLAKVRRFLEIARDSVAVTK